MLVKLGIFPKVRCEKQILETITQRIYEALSLLGKKCIQEKDPRLPFPFFQLKPMFFGKVNFRPMFCWAEIGASTPKPLTYRMLDSESSSVLNLSKEESLINYKEQLLPSDPNWSIHPWKGQD